MSEANAARPRYTSTRTTARLLMVGTAVFWLWFGIGSSYAGQAGPLSSLMRMPVPGGLFILSMIVAWRWEGIGGVLLVLQGVVSMVLMLRGFVSGALTPSNLVLMCLTLALPPLVAGGLFLIYWRQYALADGRYGRDVTGDRCVP